MIHRARARRRRRSRYDWPMPESIVRRFERAFNHQDLDGLLACFTADAVYHDTFYGAFAGESGLRTLFERMFRDGTGYAWTMESVVEDHARAAAEWSFAYTVTDAVPRSAGRAVRFRGMSLFELAAGRIAAYREYFDTGAALLQLGFTSEAIAKVLRRRPAP